MKTANWEHNNNFNSLTHEQILLWLDRYREFMFEIWRNNPSLRYPKIKDFHYSSFKVCKEYHSTSSHPIKVNCGDVLTFTNKRSSYSGWIWCIDQNNNAGWVPLNYLKILGSQCKMLFDYDSSELSVKGGEIVIVEREESGWLLCRSSSNEMGWIPIDSVEIAKKIR